MKTYQPSRTRGVGVYFDFSNFSSFMSSGFGNLVGDLAGTAAKTGIQFGLAEVFGKDNPQNLTVGGLAGLPWPGNAGAGTTNAEALLVNAQAQTQLLQQQLIAQQGQRSQTPAWVLPVAIGGGVLLLAVVLSARR